MDLPRWDACSMEPCPILRWMECHPASTGAFATMLAMLAAAAVPLYLWRQDRLSKAKERAEASKTFVAGLVGPLTVVNFDIERARYKLRVLTDSSAGWPGIPDTLRQAKLNSPTSLQDAQTMLHNFDSSIVRPVETAIAHINKYNSVVEDYWLAASEDVQRFERGRAQILNTIAELLNLVEQKIAQVIGTWGSPDSGTS